MLLGDKEVDKCFSSLQRRVGFRHFKEGFTRFRQHTGREIRDIARSLVVTCYGHPWFTPPITRAFRGLIDFIYYAQYESQSDKTLEYLTSALQQFHANKEALSRAGVRNGKQMKGLFNIPKLELMQNAVRMVRSLGSLPQFSSDQTERLHILNAKLPYRHTNRKDYGPQMCRFLDRNEKVQLFTIYLQWIRDVERSENRARCLQAGDVTSSTDGAALDSLASGLGDYESEIDLAEDEDEDEDEDEEDTSGSGGLRPSVQDTPSQTIHQAL